MTKQRILIYNYVKNCGYHPTADDVYRQIIYKNPNISLATIYRNLNLLVEMGTLTRVSMGSMSDRFDGNLKRHNHFICDNCYSVTDINIDYDIHRVRGLSGFNIKGYGITINGDCDKCCNI